MLDFAKLKRALLFCLIGSLIVSAVVAVVAILIGHFNDITTRIFFTLFIVMLHSLVSLMFVWDDERQKTFERLSFFINVVFFLIVISFVASTFGIWKIISGETVFHFYQTFFIVAFAALHADILSKVFHKEKYMDMVIYVNYVFMVLVVCMLQPIIFLNNATDVLGSFYYRILGAASLIDATLSILTIIFYKLYLNKHPNAENTLAAPKKRRMGFWVWILIIYLFFQFAFPIMFALLGLFSFLK